MDHSHGQLEFDKKLNVYQINIVFTTYVRQQIFARTVKSSLHNCSYIITSRQTFPVVKQIDAGLPEGSLFELERYNMSIYWYSVFSGDGL